MRIDIMTNDKLILNSQFHHEVSELHVQRVFASSQQTIGEEDINEIRYSSAMA